MPYSSVKLVAVSKPVISECDTAQDLIAYCARVSNPSNQNNKETAEKLVKYLIKHKHWSPLEMVHVTMEIVTTRDIARLLALISIPLAFIPFWYPTPRQSGPGAGIASGKGQRPGRGYLPLNVAAGAWRQAARQELPEGRGQDRRRVARRQLHRPIRRS